MLKAADEKAIRVTFAKLQKWMQGEVNESIDDWLESDEKSYETFNWLINHCAKNGWISTGDEMLDFADKEGIAAATTLWKRALNHSKGTK